MLAKKITYKDFDGVEKTETFYFNLTKAEIAEMQLTHPGGYVEYLDSIVESKDINEIILAFTKLILDSYGEKSEDGRYFVKNEEMKSRFHTSEPYSILLMEMIEDVDKAIEFVNAIIPASSIDENDRKELVEKTKARIEGMSQG